MRINTFELIAFILLLVGGLNWGLIGFLNFDLVAAIFGEMSFLSRAIYAVVGLSTLAVAATVLPKSMKG